MRATRPRPIAFLLFIVAGITFLGCSDNFENTLVSSQVSTVQENKAQLIYSQLDILDPAITPFISVSKLINGDNGGVLIIDTTYINYQGRLLYVYGKLKFQEFSFPGSTEFTMILRPEEASIQLFPHMFFRKEVKLKVDYKGIDLKALGHIASGYIDFAFFGDNGEIELILNQFCEVDIQDERILVDAAELRHFSRYGWVR